MRIFLVAAAVAACSVAACSSSSPGQTGKGPAQHGAPIVAPGVETSCAAPFLTTQSWPQHRAARRGGGFGTVAPGRQLVVHGYFYAAGPCQDTVPRPHRPQQPMRRVVLSLTTSDQRTRTVAIARPSGSRFGFDSQFRVPRDAAPGPAVVSDGEQHTVRLTIARR